MATPALQRWEEPQPINVEHDGGAEVALAVRAERARGYEASSKPANTWRAYRSDLRHFGAGCRNRGLVALPAEPDTVSAV